MDETSFEQIRPSVKLKVNSITRLLLHAQAESGPHQRIRAAASNRGIHERVILMIEEPLTWAKELAEVTCGPLQTDWFSCSAYFGLTSRSLCIQTSPVRPTFRATKTPPVMTAHLRHTASHY